DQRQLVEEIRLREANPRAQMLDALELLDARTPDHAANLVSLLEQQLGEIRSVLAGHARDQGPLDVTHPCSIVAGARSRPRSPPPPVAILETHDVVQLRGGDLEHVTVLERGHSVAKRRGNVHSVAGVENLAVTLARLGGGLQLHAPRENADRLFLPSM